jgi:hypothetical protein
MTTSTTIQKMQNPSIVLYGAKNAKLQDTPIPEISDPHHVLVRIAYVGVCGSDVSFIFLFFVASILSILLRHSFLLLNTIHFAYNLPPSTHQLPVTMPLPTLSLIPTSGPLLHPRRHRKNGQPCHRNNHGPRSLRYNPLHRLIRLFPQSRRPCRHRTRYPMSSLWSL